MIGSRYYLSIGSAAIDSLDAYELDCIDRGESGPFVRHYKSRTDASMYHAIMMWNTLRVHLGYEQVPEVTP